MDISGLTNTASAQSFPGYGGTASLPAMTQAKLMAQSQSLSLIPAVSGPNLGSLGNLYDAVGKQTLGALSGLSAQEITLLSMGIGDGQTAPAPPSDPPAQPSRKDPAIGATLANLLKEDGYVAPEANPYVVNKDYFSDPGSLGGLLDSRV